jgi:23S rRNA (cytidine1920-2'-O)/16S rRNA (cytidine1409-2'-O)-methyltransferase
MKQRLDQAIAERNLTASRSQAESYIKLGLVKVNGKVIDQPAYMVLTNDKISIEVENQYVSRAGLKLESIADKLGLDFESKNVLDVGSSTGGFTDYALKHGARKVIAVELGVGQLHPKLIGDKRIELHEKTDIRDINKLSTPVDLALIDVSFVSLREIIPAVLKLINPNTQIIPMFKPQFETSSEFRHKGVIKNDKIRRKLLADFEAWLQSNELVVIKKADSEVLGAKGNTERFYLIKKAQKP